MIERIKQTMKKKHNENTSIGEPKEMDGWRISAVESETSEIMCDFETLTQLTTSSYKRWNSIIAS